MKQVKTYQTKQLINKKIISSKITAKESTLASYNKTSGRQARLNYVTN